MIVLTASVTLTTHTCAEIWLEGYLCLCESGYGGRYCTTDLNECQLHRCANGATCIDFVNGYRYVILVKCAIVIQERLVLGSLIKY